MRFIHNKFTRALNVTEIKIDPINYQLDKRYVVIDQKTMDTHTDNIDLTLHVIYALMSACELNTSDLYESFAKKYEAQHPDDFSKGMYLSSNSFIDDIFYQAKKASILISDTDLKATTVTDANKILMEILLRIYKSNIIKAGIYVTSDITGSIEDLVNHTEIRETIKSGGVVPSPCSGYQRNTGLKFMHDTILTCNKNLSWGVAGFGFHTVQMIVQFIPEVIRQITLTENCEYIYKILNSEYMMLKTVKTMGIFEPHPTNLHGEPVWGYTIKDYLKLTTDEERMEYLKSSTWRSFCGYMADLIKTDEMLPFLDRTLAGLVYFAGTVMWDGLTKAYMEELVRYAKRHKIDVGAILKGHPSGTYAPKPEDDAPAKDSSTTDALDMLDMLTEEKGKYKYDVAYSRDKDDGTIKKYNKLSDVVKLESRLFEKKIKSIRRLNTGGKQRGLASGKLDMKNIYKYKTDHNIFLKNTYKIKETDLAVGLVLDVSGSMYGDGIRNGTNAMILMHEVLTTLKINHSIVTHTSSGRNHCDIEVYHSFKQDKVKVLDKAYGLVNIRARSGNCDSGALNYMYHKIKKVPNRDKLCIIFSDGEPTECTGKDLKEQVTYMNKNGVHTIGIGIGFDGIAQYYPNHANGKNMRELINILNTVLDDYVLANK